MQDNSADAEIARRIAQEQLGADFGFAVEPRSDCVHLALVSNNTDGVQKSVELNSCSKCSDPSENWICLSCTSCFCSRYVNGHMLEHSTVEQPDHVVALSLSDMSVWCFACDSYVRDGKKGSGKLTKLHKAAYVAKFGEEPSRKVRFSDDDHDGNGSASGSGGGSSSSQ
ncbi:hypothetical protein BJ742DRAFT_814774 [Cladochytrium replicatum]|nr:hypothetical protein BJ742DRAFT_814774 [Cladochytrium replicatum]